MNTEERKAFDGYLKKAENTQNSFFETVKYLYAAFKLLFSKSKGIKGDVYVTSVCDGDSFYAVPCDDAQNPNPPVLGIRLWGINAPEINQPKGNAAKKFLKSIIEKKIVNIEPIHIDKYGRTVAIVYLGNLCLNEHLLHHKMAVVDKRFCRGQFFKKWKQIENM